MQRIGVREDEPRSGFRCGLVLGALVLAAFGTSEAAPADAVVIVEDDAGYQESTLRTLRSIVSSELRSSGVDVLDDARIYSSATAENMKSLEAIGVGRAFVLRLGRLEDKLLMSLEELAPPSVAPVFVSRLTATSVDEADKVIGRLVTSVISRTAVEKTARLATVTEDEAEPFQKKPGEGLFILGVGLAPLGASIGWSHEAEHWRLGVLFQGDEDVGFFGIDGAWLPSNNNISPYFGVGLGVVGPDCDDCDDGAVIGTKLEVGAEFFRLHGARLMVGVHAIIPFESRFGMDTFNPGIHVRVGF